MTLLLECHGATWHQDDHMGKLPSGETFLRAPARLERDVELVKSALGKLAAEGRDVGLNAEAVDVLRWHGAKATLSSVMQHLNLPRRVVRWQGNWQSQADTMPDTYLRESQVLILSCQDKCLEYLRQGGDLVRLVGEAVNPDNIPESGQAEEARRERAMAACPSAFPDVGSLPNQLLDGAFEDGKVSAAALEKEKSSLSGEFNPEKLLEEIDMEIQEDTPRSSDSEAEKSKAKEEMGKEDLQDPLEASDEVDSEKLTPYWVQAKVPGPRPKVHLPSVASLEEKPITKAIPRCGAAGNFELMKVEDPLDPCHEALSEASIPAAFQRSAAQFGVAESDYLILSSLGIHSYESFALRIHSKEALEEFMRDTICPQAAYNDPTQGLIV
eukprot:s4096_g7.t1